MVKGKGPLSMIALLLVPSFLSVLLIGSVAPAQPSEYCAPVCEESLAPILTACNGVWRLRAGRSLYGPFTYAGPIEIAIEARPVAPDEFTYPLYVEVLWGGALETCSHSGPGSVLWETRGTSSCDSTWVVSPPIRMPWRMQLGDRYWLQVLRLHTDPAEFPPPRYVRASPAIRCLRVRTVEVTITPGPWSSVKKRYR